MLSLKGIFLPVLIASQSALAEETIKIGFAYFPPYSKVENGKCEGHYCEIAKQIFTDNLGIEIEVIQHPWARIQREVELGNIDAMFALPSEKRQIYAVISEAPVYRSAMKVFTYRGHARLDEIRRITTVADIKDLNLVSITNQGNGWHAEHVEILGINTVHAISDKHILKMLAAQRGDIVIDAAPSMRHMIGEMNLGDNVIELEVVLDAAEIHIIINRNSRFASLMPQLNQIIASAGARDSASTSNGFSTNISKLIN